MIVLSMKTLVLLAVVMGAVALFAPVYWLVCLDLVWVIFPGNASLGGTRVGALDVTIACLVITVVLRGRKTLIGQRLSIPYFKTWLLLGIFFTLSYLLAPINQESLTDPIRIGYQVYRYCWRPILLYPVCVLFLQTLEQRRLGLMAAMLGADICAIEGIIQGYAGGFATGPFYTYNQLAGVLVAPFVLALAGTLTPASRGHWLFSFGSLVVIGRAMLFAGSRGGTAGVIGGSAFFLAMLMFEPAGRKRVLRLLPVFLLLPILLFIVKPDVLERPTVQRALSLTEGKEVSTFQWRYRYRWPHFWRIAVANPILGIGTDVDWSLGPSGNTPHSGYLSMVVTYGFPAAILFFWFAIRLVRDGLILLRKALDRESRYFGLTLAAPVVGLLVHNIVEVTLKDPSSVMKVFWLMVAAGVMTVRDQKELAQKIRAEQEEAEAEAWYGEPREQLA